MKGRNNLNIIKTLDAKGKVSYELINAKGRCIAKGKADPNKINWLYAETHNPVINYVNEFKNAKTTTHKSGSKKRNRV